ncbi:MAG TPA: hypothetical protein VM597_37175 [Gemmataceae bacterium]|jgi:hypothetical protein|nr:hypothetical protein [Gemmataceae bacterium]
MGEKKTKPKKRAAGRGIGCPGCGTPTQALYTRPGGAVTFRRRVCPKCGARVTTAEKIVNRGAGPGSENRTAAAISITELLKTIGLTPADLQSPVTLHFGGTDHV